MRAADGRDGVFNLGVEKPEISIRSLADQIAHTVGKEVAWRNGADTPGSPQRRCPDMTKTTKVAGYTAQVDLSDGIRQTYDWYRQRRFS